MFHNIPTKIYTSILFISIVSMCASVSLVRAQEVAPVLEADEPLRDIDGLGIQETSCLYLLDSGEEVPFGPLLANPNNPPTSVSCMIFNDTPETLYATPSLKLLFASGEEIILQTEGRYILFPNSKAQTVIFAFPQALTGEIQEVEISLTGDFVAKTLSSNNPSLDRTDPQVLEVTDPSPKGCNCGDAILYGIIIMLSLIVILALLVYRQKRNDQLLAQTPPSTDGEGEA